MPVGDHQVEMMGRLWPEAFGDVRCSLGGPRAGWPGHLAAVLGLSDARSTAFVAVGRARPFDSHGAGNSWQVSGKKAAWAAWMPCRESDWA